MGGAAVFVKSCGGLEHTHAHSRSPHHEQIWLLDLALDLGRMCAARGQIDLQKSKDLWHP